MTVTVDGNAPPVAATLGSLDVEEGKTIDIDVLTGATDPEGHTISLLSVVTPTTGTAVIATIQIPDPNDQGGYWDTDPDGNSYWNGATISKQIIRYTAAIGSVGTVTISYTIEDELAAQTTGTFDLNITANPLPMAVDEAVIIEQNTTVQIDVLANDSDPDNEAFSITVVTQPATGTATILTIQIP